jgi:hypothetical protein
VRRTGPKTPVLPLPPAAEEPVIEPDEEDVAFFQTRPGSRFLANAALEEGQQTRKRKPAAPLVVEEYEREPRAFAEPPVHAAEQTEALPRKNADGEWVYEKQAASPAATEKTNARVKLATPAPPSASRSRAVEALRELQEEELTMEEKRGRIAAASNALMESPERNVGELKVSRFYWTRLHFR